MPHPSDFRDRVRTAASIISSGKPATRRFEGCFECFDGDAVAVALYRRTLKRPDTNLARNLWQYLHRPTVLNTVYANRHVSDLDSWSASLIAHAATQAAALHA